MDARLIVNQVEMGSLPTTAAKLRRVSMKQRNHVVLALIRTRKTTKVHQKSNKAKRRNSKVKLQEDYNGFISNQD